MLPINRTHLAILRVLNEEEGRIIGSREIARRLKLLGVDISERTVRYHLRILDEKGLTKVFGREGRMITEKGKEELSNSFVSEKVGFIISKIDTLSYMTNLDLETMTGQVILNISFFPKRSFKEALRVMKPVFSSDFVMSDMVVVLEEGQIVGDTVVPEGSIGFGTVCSVTINGILLKEGIPVHSRFGGVLEIEEGQPLRFVSLISYEGSSLDPLEIFIRGKMTTVRQAVRKKAGRILASFREVPVVCHRKVTELAEYLRQRGIKGILAIGDPNKELFEVSVGLDRAGIVVVGGLNPVAAVEEAGIPTDSKAMSCLYEFSELRPFKEIYKESSGNV
jgi:repressor of nif and glnA expression